MSSHPIESTEDRPETSLVELGLLEGGGDAYRSMGDSEAGAPQLGR